MAASLKLKAHFSSRGGRRRCSPNYRSLLDNVVSPMCYSSPSIFNQPSVETLTLNPQSSFSSGLVFVKNLGTTSGSVSQASPYHQIPGDHNQQGWPNYRTSDPTPNPNHNSYPDQGYSKSYQAQNYNHQNAGYQRNQNYPNQSVSCSENPMSYQVQNYANPNQTAGYPQNPVPYQIQDYQSQNDQNQNRGGRGSGIPYSQYQNRNQGYSQGVSQNQWKSSQNQAQFTLEGIRYPDYCQARNEGQQVVSNHPHAPNQGQQVYNRTKSSSFVDLKACCETGNVTEALTLMVEGILADGHCFNLLFELCMKSKNFEEAKKVHD